MNKIYRLIILAILGFIVWNVFSDRKTREKFFNKVESSTGVDINRNTRKLIKKTSDALAETAKDATEILHKKITDPQFRKSVKKWSKDAWNKIDKGQLEKLQSELERESKKSIKDYNRILEKHLGKPGY